MNGNIGNMGDMGSMLSKLLEDPESLGKVMNIASTLSSSGALSGLSLGNIGGKEAHETIESSQNEEGEQVHRESPQDDGGAKQTYSEVKHDENSKNRKQSGNKIRPCDRIRLLEAMRPFLSDDKRDKLEVVIKILGLAEAAGGLHGIKK